MYHNLCFSTLVLILTRDGDLIGHHVSVVPTLRASAGNWGWSTRVARLFPLDDSRFPDMDCATCTRICFVGPLDPSLLDRDFPTFITWGTYNVVFATNDPEQALQVREFIASFPTVLWEEWSIREGALEKIEYAPRILEHPTSHPSILRESGLSSTLSAADEENSLLLAASTAKTAVYFPANLKDSETFAYGFRKMLAEGESKHEIDRLSWLVHRSIKNFT